LGRLNRALNRSEYSFNIENCLRLARLSGEPPSRVLRLAGKGEVADLIEWLYGPPALTVTQKHLLERWAYLSAPLQEALLALITALARASGAPPPAPAPRRRTKRR